jgi:F-type H+-transporting ATPase subunit epsilon
MIFKLNIVTPTKKLIADAELKEVFVPAHRGELNILPGHSPLVSTLSPGVLKYQVQGQPQMEAVAISWGYVEVTPSGVNILAETAEHKSEIDLERARQALASAEDYLNKPDATPEDVDRYHSKRRRAEARIQVALS